ncbi:MAG: EamA family transporter RarD [Kiloniellales bacterium]|nr:EamA family transporter RarD [Kiloniellales bacterium]
MARQDERKQAVSGVLFALSAFGIWGVNPVYFKAVAHLPELEVLAHRVVWTVALLAALVTATRGWAPIGRALRDRRTLGLLALSTALISVNWFIYIWAVVAERVLETSLGYFINPLISVLLGVLVLGERLSRLQGAAVALAALGVLNLGVATSGLPWVALSLAVTFGFYGLIRKTVAIGSAEGLLVETGLMLPLALVYLLAVGGKTGFFGSGSPADVLLLLAAGLVSATPLLCFTSAARRLRLSTVGMFQYLAPSCQFLLAIFAFGETFTRVHLVTFLCIWAALGIFTLDSLRRSRRVRPAAAPAGAE